MGAAPPPPRAPLGPGSKKVWNAVLGPEMLIKNCTSTNDCQEARNKLNITDK